MKKTLCLTLALAFGATTFAQKAYEKMNHPKVNESVETSVVQPKDPAIEAADFTPPSNMVQVQTTKSSMNYDETHVWTTQYDVQSNAAISNRVYQWPDGTVSAVSTWGLAAAAYPDRGTGYNHYDGSTWGPLPTERVESVRSGWPSIAPLGENGEVIVSHGGTPFGINVYTRETKGTGDWMMTQLPNPGTYELTWPRVITSGDDNMTIHVVATDQGAINELIPIFYTKSTDGGETWADWAGFPELDDELYNGNLSADDYVFARNGDVLALAFFSAWTDLFYIKSVDGGETWEHHVVWEHPYQSWDWATMFTPDTLYSVDNSGNMTIDYDGNVHLVWGCGRVGVLDAPSPDGSYSFWPYTEGIGYWNETMGQIPTHPDNPHWTMSAEYLDELGMLVGWVPDEDGDGEVSIFELEIMTYNALSLTNNPTIAIDEAGTILIAYSTISETRDNGAYYFRSIYVTYKDGIYGTWYYNADNLMDNFIHLFDEGIYPTAAPLAYDNTFWLIYNTDNTPGLSALATPDHEPQDNLMYAVKIGGYWVGLEDFTNPVNSISSAYPNPASGSHVNFDLSLSKASNNVVVSVYNLAGQLVSQDKKDAFVGNNKISVETENLQNGVYFCTITVDNYKETRKFVVR